MPSNDKNSKLAKWDFDDIFVRNTTDSQCYRLTNQQVAALLVPLQQMAWRTRWANAVDFDDEITEFVGELSNALMRRGTGCGSGGGGGSGGSLALPDCLVLLDCDENGIVDTIEINESECEEMVCINVYSNCGCGNNSGNIGGNMANGNGDNGFSVPLSPGTGGLPSDTPTYCDVISTWVPRVAKQAEEFFLVMEDLVQQYGESGLDKIVEGLIGDFPFVGNLGAVFVDWVTDVLEIGVQYVRQMYGDANHIEDMQVAWVKAFGDRVAPTQFTRNDFRAWAGKMPLAFYSIPTVIVPPRVTFRLFSEFFDLAALNARLRTSVGTAEPGLCSFIYDRAQVAQPDAPTPNSDTGGVVGTTLCGSYDFRTGPQNWQVIPEDVSSSPYRFGNTNYSSSQQGWARGFVDGDNAEDDLGIRALANGTNIVSISEVVVVGSSTNGQGAAGPSLSLWKSGTIVYQRTVQWPVKDGSEQTLTFDIPSIDADEVRIVVGSLRGNDILVINQVDIVCE